MYQRLSIAAQPPPLPMPAKAMSNTTTLPERLLGFGSLRGLPSTSWKGSMRLGQNPSN